MQHKLNSSLLNQINEAEHKLNLLYSKSETRFLLKVLLKHFFNLNYNFGNHFKVDVSEQNLIFFEKAIKRLLQNEPWQYVLGNCDFYGLTINVNNEVLIPRPETEELVGWILEEHKQPSLKVHDACTGSGCIALALKSKRINWTVFGSDVSENALEIAKLNGNKLLLDVSFLTLDILQTKQLQLPSVDIWVSNPPYIHPIEKTNMDNRVLDFEPHIALFTPEYDVLIFYKQIAHLAYQNLNERGWLYVEVHEDYAIDTKNLFEMHGFINIEIKHDMQKKPRMIKAQKP